MRKRKFNRMFQNYEKIINHITVINRKIMSLLLASAICKHDENFHQEFTRKEINQIYQNIFS